MKQALSTILFLLLMFDGWVFQNPLQFFDNSSQNQLKTYHHQAAAGKRWFLTVALKH